MYLDRHQLLSRDLAGRWIRNGVAGTGTGISHWDAVVLNGGLTCCATSQLLDMMFSSGRELKPLLWFLIDFPLLINFSEMLLLFFFFYFHGSPRCISYNSSDSAMKG